MILIDEILSNISKLKEDDPDKLDLALKAIVLGTFASKLDEICERLTKLEKVLTEGGGNE